MQKSSTLFLSLLVLSGMVLNACGGADGIEEIIEEAASETEEAVEVEIDEDGKSGEEEEGNEEPAEITTPIVDDSQALADAIKEDLAALPETTYKNNSYTATGEYQSPAGPESISITLIVQDDKVTSATVVPHAEHATSLSFQEKFAGGVVMQVVGMNLDEINVGNVSGSSLTSKGFNSALASIKSQAS